jgi:membrane protease YdiL (CAAX protease family)
MTALDMALTLCLLLLLPGYNLWRSLTERKRPPETSTRRYVRGTAIAVALTALMAVAWSSGARPLARLGLDIPVSTPGVIGLGLAAILLTALLVMGRMIKPPAGASAAAPPETAMLPETPAEWRLFLVSMPIIATAWELLYRGYLVWAIEPRFGIVPAVLLPALAYGVAHGYHGRNRFIGSIVSALLFTLGFVLTRSLWWLIAIHIALPLFGAFAQRRLNRTAA